MYPKDDAIQRAALLLVIPMIMARRYKPFDGGTLKGTDMAEANVVDEVIKRLTAHKSVEGVLVLTGEGIPIRSTLDNAMSIQYAGWVRVLSLFYLLNASSKAHGAFENLCVAT